MPAESAPPIQDVSRTPAGQGLVSRVKSGNVSGPVLSAAPVRLSAIGGIALALGMLVYATDRDAAHALLFPAVAALGSGPVFGAVGLWLPSFVHPFAFSLFTAAALPRSPSPAYGACAAWWLVNVAFEVAQHAQISVGLASSLQGFFGKNWLTRAVSNYWLRGSFNVGDLVAVTAGALAAAVVLFLVHRQEVPHAL